MGTSYAEFIGKEIQDGLPSQSPEYGQNILTAM
jgi:hypothetical protein